MKKESVLEYIKEYAKTKPDILAVCELRKTVTYKEYWSNISKMANVLGKMAIKKGSHVVLRCTQSIDFLTIFSALQYIGALVIPIEKAVKPERVIEIAKEVDASIVISDVKVDGMTSFLVKELISEMEEEDEINLPLPKEEEHSMLLFTTGTTGKSKGVVVKHINDVAIAENVIVGTHMREGNVEIIPMPLNHAYGMRRYQSDMVHGGTVCLMDGMVLIGNLWKLIDTYHATSMALSPAFLSMIFQLSGDRIASYQNQFDYIQIGSAPLGEADKKRLLTLMPNTRLYNFYGASEAGCSCILDFNSPDDVSGCIGRPTVNSIMRFVDEDGNTVMHPSEEEPALLSWGGKIVVEGYYKDPEMTKETIEDGYVRTKDLAYLDDEGRCILVGRADDIINCGGNKISPVEVEGCARGYAQIMDCAYGSQSDEVAGEVPVMLVVPKEGYQESEFVAYLTKRLEAYKLPKTIYYVESIPKTFKGSLLRKQIKKIIESYKEEYKNGRIY
ncbi:MAG: class I adenylate-forming enzyme family protein [Eubacteriales bacterium]|nr:class I adenylate-forming enzyme family protein [Eubacteriales bacterium]